MRYEKSFPMTGLRSGKPVNRVKMGFLDLEPGLPVFRKALVTVNRSPLGGLEGNLTFFSTV
jgi:hypothetical protein